MEDLAKRPFGIVINKSLDEETAEILITSSLVHFLESGKYVLMCENIYDNSKNRLITLMMCFIENNEDKIIKTYLGLEKSKEFEEKIVVSVSLNENKKRSVYYYLIDKKYKK